MTDLSQWVPRVERNRLVTTSAAQALLGVALEGGWQVTQRLERPPGATGGFFSAGYVVERDGTRAFLKAIDYAKAMTGPTTVDQLRVLTAAYVFERDLVRSCAGAHLSHVVAGVDDGEISISGYAVPQVPYLIFERADRDVRAQVDDMAILDVAWSLRSLHNVAVGLQQLHHLYIAHQDVKPSNVMVFEGQGDRGTDRSKIGDLGRAAVLGIVTPHDHLDIPGDRSYAPPELLYGSIDPEVTRRTRACDAYLLGSLICFFFTGIGTTAAMHTRLDAIYHAAEWGGTFEEVLPYLYDAFDRVIADFEDEVPDLLKRDLTKAFRELCEPDPARRGHPKERPSTATRYSMPRYVTLLDRLARTAEIHLARRFDS
jgi:eukaryotic-like serine/threonine-protein kinase